MAIKAFAANGFLFNPQTREVLLHLRDGNTPHDPDKWAFFGGGGELSETPRDCFVREIGEEVGADITPRNTTHIRTYPRTEPDGTPYMQHTFYAESELKKSDMKLTEGADFDWISIDSVFSYDLCEDAKTGLALFMKKYI